MYPKWGTLWWLDKEPTPDIKIHSTHARDRMAHHRNRRFNTKALFNNSFEIWHLIEILESHWPVTLTRADTILLFTNFSKNIGVVGKVLESIDQAAAHGILACE